MKRDSTDQLLNRLEELKLQFNLKSAASCSQLLKRFQHQQLKDPNEFIRLHETLLFIRAYPQSADVLTMADTLLRSFPTRITTGEAKGIDLSPLDHPELSGVAGRTVTDTFTYNVVRWLSHHFPRQIEFYWDWFESENRLVETWPRFMPLLEEDAFVEANIPFQEWLKEASGQNDLRWLVDRFEALPLTDLEKSELYDSQQLYIQWTPPYRAARTGMRLPAKLSAAGTFYHQEKLLRRHDISFAAELEKSPPALELLSRGDGEAVLDLTREASTVRYRELYGFTHGDSRRVLRADLGRGVDLFFIGLPPEKRLPLRAYHAAMFFKNRVPIGYFEGLSLFERMESGFNLYYTFREGETAWLYARTLNIMRHVLGVTTFSLDPYQIGFENEEGIESGAFWFYRKLGFRSTEPGLRELTKKEESKIKNRQAYRTPARTLRKLATAPMVFELNEDRTGDWDRFQVRRIGFALQREMAKSFRGDATRMRREAIETAEQTLKFGSRNLRDWQLKMFSDFASVLLLIPDLNRWSNDDNAGLVKILRAKIEADEAKYLTLMQRHDPLRRAIIKLGSS